MMLGMWLASVGSALVVARFRLSSQNPTLRDELLARGVAFLAVTFALSGFSLASIAFTTTSLVIVVALPGWALTVLPLLAPPIRRSTGGLLISSETWVYVSVGLSVATGLAMAFYVLARLLMTRPELM